MAKSRLVPRNTPDLEDHDELLEITHQSSRGGQEPPAEASDRPEQNVGHDEAVKGAKFCFSATAHPARSRAANPPCKGWTSVQSQRAPFLLLLRHDASIRQPSASRSRKRDRQVPGWTGDATLRGWARAGSQGRHQPDL